MEEEEKKKRLTYSHYSTKKNNLCVLPASTFFRFSSTKIFKSHSRVISAVMVISEAQWPIQESVFAY